MRSSIGAVFAIPCAAVLLACHLDSAPPYTVTPGGDAAPGSDATVRDALDDDAPGEGGRDSGAFPDGPPPNDDAAIEDFGTKPPPGAHVEATIGPAGGTLAGVDGAALAGVTLVVPPGALSAPTTLALDLDPAMPPSIAGGTPLTPFVRVGPEGTPFAIPARLTLPWSTTPTAPDQVMLARVGGAWSALLDPSGNSSARSLTASMRRASGAQGFALTVSAAPRPLDVSPSTAPVGAVVFVEGSGFGLAPAWRDGDAGVIVSGVSIGGVAATALGWTDTTVSVRVPAGDGGVVVVTTAGGTGSPDGGLVVGP